MTISLESWEDYIDALRKVSDEAANKFAKYFLRIKNPMSPAGRQALIDYAYVLGRDYGEAAAELACETYDAMVELSGVPIYEPAIPAPTATYSEAAKTVNGVLKTSRNPEEIAGAVARLVKMAGVDTTMQNALRDGAEWAWVPHGETCAFCITLASRGWQRASKKAIKNGHAQHIHSNCDCTYAIRFNADTDIEGYDPDKYLEMYYSAEGDTPKEQINSMRREFYAENKEKINAQKRSAYEKRKERESSSAEEIELNI